MKKIKNYNELKDYQQELKSTIRDIEYDFDKKLDMARYGLEISRISARMAQYLNLGMFLKKAGGKAGKGIGRLIKKAFNKLTGKQSAKQDSETTAV